MTILLAFLVGFLVVAVFGLRGQLKVVSKRLEQHRTHGHHYHGMPD